MAALLWYCDADQRARPAPSTLLHTCWSSLHVQHRPNKEHSRACAKGAPYIIPMPSCHHHHHYHYYLLFTRAVRFRNDFPVTPSTVPTDHRDAMSIIIIIIIVIISYNNYLKRWPWATHIKEMHCEKFQRWYDGTCRAFYCTSTPRPNLSFVIASTGSFGVDECVVLKPIVNKRTILFV